MKTTLSVVVLGLLLTFPAGFAYSQEHQMEKGPRGREGMPPVPMPGGPMDSMMRQRGMGMLLRNPKLAGVMMQMRGEMMRIRGEAMMKAGDVLRRYGERLEKERGQ